MGKEQIETMSNSLDNNYEAHIAKLIHTAGKLKLSEKEKQALYKDIEGTEIQIKADGTIFAPWAVYSKRLNDAVGGFGWALIPQGNPIDRDGFVFWGFHLIIRGCYCGFAYGQNEYTVKKSDFMHWGNAIEGAKSNALMRCCKELGIGHKLWDKAFIAEWMSKYAYQDPSGAWKLGKAPEAVAPDKRKQLEAEIEAKLLKCETKEALEAEWNALDEDVQKLKEIFTLFKKHIVRVASIPKKIEKIYAIESTDQQRAINDYCAQAEQYKTAVEIEQNLEADLKEYIQKGLMKENADTFRKAASVIVNNKRMALKGRTEKAAAA